MNIRAHEDKVWIEEQQEKTLTLDKLKEIHEWSEKQPRLSEYFSPVSGVWMTREAWSREVEFEDMINNLNSVKHGGYKS